MEKEIVEGGGCSNYIHVMFQVSRHANDHAVRIT